MSIGAVTAGRAKFFPYACSYIETDNRMGSFKGSML